MLFLSFTAEQDKPLTESVYSVYDSRSFIHCGKLNEQLNLCSLWPCIMKLLHCFD